jgi:hypothetical protein
MENTESVYKEGMKCHICKLAIQPNNNVVKDHCHFPVNLEAMLTMSHCDIPERGPWILPAPEGRNGRTRVGASGASGGPRAAIAARGGW